MSLPVFAHQETRGLRYPTTCASTSRIVLGPVLHALYSQAGRRLALLPEHKTIGSPAESCTVYMYELAHEASSRQL